MRPCCLERYKVLQQRRSEIFSSVSAQHSCFPCSSRQCLCFPGALSCPCHVRERVCVSVCVRDVYVCRCVCGARADSEKETGS